LGVVLEITPMDLLTFFHNINSNINSAILSVLNPVLFIELTVACCLGMYQGWMIGKATISQITELALYTVMLLGMHTARKINL
jgi:hypothetical protein